MRTRLLSRGDIESLVQHPRIFEQEEKLLLCTVMEPLLVADAILKNRMRLDWASFQEGWQKVVNSKRVCIAALDADCLNRALFDRSDTYAVAGLWSEVRERALTPDHTVRRLILRPSEQTWWDAQLYAEMESWYGEEQIDG